MINFAVGRNMLVSLSSR